MERPAQEEMEAYANRQHQLVCPGCEPSGKQILQPQSSLQVTSALQPSNLSAEAPNMWNKDKRIPPCPEFLPHRHCEIINDDRCFKPLCFEVICCAVVTNTTVAGEHKSLREHKEWVISSI